MGWSLGPALALVMVLSQGPRDSKPREEEPALSLSPPDEGAELLGETVSAVEVRLPPGSDVAAAVEQIAVRKGQRLSLRALSRSVERLYASGKYADVVVRSRRGDAPAGGVWVTFELEPFRQISEIRVEGNAVIPSGNILAAAKLSQREAFFPEKIQNAADRVRELYRRAGYEACQVTLEQEETIGGGLGIRIQVEEGRPTRIASLTFAGDPGFPLRRLVRQLGLDVGSVLNRDLLDRGVERLQELYRREHHYRARIDEPLVNSSEGQATVAIPVVAGARYELTFHHNHSFPDAALLRVLDYDGSELLDPGMLQRLTRKLEAFYGAQGYYSARVFARELVRPDGRAAKLLFEIDEGQRVVVESIRFQGNRFFTDDALEKEIARGAETVSVRGDPGLNSDPLETEGRSTSPAPSWGDNGGGRDVRTVRVFSDPLYRDAADAMRDRYRYEGFLAAEVRFETAELDVQRGLARVRFEVEEGPRTQIADVALEGVPPGVDPHALVHLRRGNPLRSTDVESTRTGVIRELARRGYLFARVEVAIEALERSAELERARVRVAVRPGPQVRVGKVLVQGSARSREAMVRANLDVKEGQVLDPETLFSSQRNILQLGIYRSAVVRLMNPESEEPTKDVVVELTDRPQLSGTFGLGYSLVDGPRIIADALYPNVNGRGVNITGRLKLNYVGASALVLSRNSVIDPSDVSGLAGLGGRLNISAIWPRIYGLLPAQFNGRLDLVGERVQRPSFRFTRYATIAGLDWVATRWLNFSLQYEIERDMVDSSSRAEVYRSTVNSIDIQRLRFDDGVFNLQSLRFTPTLDFRDEPLNPHRGFFLQGGAEVTKDLGAQVKDALGVLVPTSIFTLKLQANATAYFPIFRPVVLALSIRGGTILPLEPNSVTIAPKRFFLGGASSMRGFREDGVIPQDRRSAFGAERQACRGLASSAGCTAAAGILQSGRELPSPGGDLFALSKAEVRFPILGSFDMGVFFEAGNLWLSRTDVDLLKLRTVAGAGIRYLTPVGPLVFDLGFNLHPDALLNEQPFYVHFSIGLF